MSLKDLKVLDFINEVDSSSPAPGGGSVSALASTLGISLTRMVGHLTLNRKLFFELSETLQTEYKYHFNLLSVIKDQLLYFMEEDTNAFNAFMEALKLPKGNEEEIQVRKEAIYQATIKAIEVPLEVAKLSIKALDIVSQMMKYGNKNAISDIGVGTLLLCAGLEGAILNVKINLSSLADDELVKYQKECQKILNQSKVLKELIMNFVNESL